MRKLILSGNDVTGSRAKLSVPVLSPILRKRTFGLAISLVALLQLSLETFGVSGWQCPIFHALGVPCPGCGLTRATLSLFHGEWKQAVVSHAFAPFLVLALAIITSATAAPTRLRRHIISATESVERHTGITGLLLIGLIVYWLARLVFLQSAFARLIQG